MSALTQANRPIRIDTPVGPDKFVVRALEGREALSELFQFHLELLSEDASIEASAIVGKHVTIGIARIDGTDRYFSGYVSRFGFSGWHENYPRYEMVVVPWLWFLTRTTDCAIFQTLSTPDIVDAVFDKFGLKGFRQTSLSGTYSPWEYCVQYRETAYNFVARLLEHEGIFYFFKHSNGAHQMFIADHVSAHEPNPLQPQVAFQLTGGSAVIKDDDTISVWQRHIEFRSGQWAQNDFNFKTPRSYLLSTVTTRNDVGNTPYETYDYPGVYEDSSRGRALTRLRMEAEEAGFDIITGQSDCRAMTPGFRFDLQDHPRRDQNSSYLVTAVNHRAEQGGFRSGEQSVQTYENDFTCIPYATPFRPALHTPKPVVRGSQTALVVGPKGEEIYTDEYGRVKVQFHWDRDGLYNENSSCWIRVAQLSAGTAWGGLTLPRIGQEVIVDFLEGDPDRPLITGRVYNADSRVPYALPDEMTKSTIKTLSTKGGGGFNEIRFEDKKGNEQIFMHAEKDVDYRIKNDRREWIGQDHHLDVTRDRREKIERDQHLNITRDHIAKIGRDHNHNVAGKQACEVDGSQSSKVGGDVIEVYSGNQSTQVSSSYYLKGDKVVIEATSGLTLKVGGNYINISSSGIQIQGTQVMINSGGAALSGVAGNLVSPLAPTDPNRAADADPGAMAELPTRPPRLPASPPQMVGNVTAVHPVLGTVAPTASRMVAAFDAPTHNPSSDENKSKQHWIEIALVGEDGKPIPGELYAVTLPDGQTVADGTLDDKGWARVENIDAGNCLVTFPNLDKDAWESL